jgi:hypothetical protein
LKETKGPGRKDLLVKHATHAKHAKETIEMMAQDGRYGLKKRHPAKAGRRAGDAITGGVMARFYNLATKQSSTELIIFQLGADSIRRNQLPNPVVKPDGVKLWRPAEWK